MVLGFGPSCLYSIDVLMLQGRRIPENGPRGERATLSLESSTLNP